MTISVLSERQIEYPALKDAPQWILVGMIKRIHGQKGELLIKPLTERPEDRFRQGSELYMSLKREERRSPVRIASSRMTGRGPLVKLEGYGTRDEAWPLFGASLFVPASELAKPEEGRYYAFQLEGCEVFEGTRRVGLVTGLVEPPRANPYLEVDPGGGEPPVLVPFVSRVVKSVDPEHKRIDIAEGFLG